MRKNIKLALIFVMMVSVFALAAISVNASTVLISTADELADIELDGDYKLANDIDLTGIDFTPIGDESQPFTGTFDGDGNRIIGLTFTSVSKNIGLFGCIDGATIKNLELLNANVKINSSKKYDMFAGLICAVAKGGVFENCTVSGDIDIKHLGNVYAAGICAHSDAKTEPSLVFPTYKLCRNNANINAEVLTGSYRANSAGITAYGMFASISACENNGSIKVASYSSTAAGICSSYAYQTVSQCANNGDVTSVGNGMSGSQGEILAGGIIADIPSAESVFDCFNTGAVYAHGNGQGVIAGGICAKSRVKSAFERCYNVGEITAEKGTSEGTSGSLVGAASPRDTFANNFVIDALDIPAVGMNSVSGAATELSKNEMKTADSFTGFDFDDVWYMPSEVASYRYPRLQGLRELKVTAGDSNGDGQIAPTDVINLARYLAGFNGYDDQVEADGADVDGDNKLTSIDLTILTRHIAQWKGYEILPLKNAE